MTEPAASERIVWGGRYAVYDEIASGGMAVVFLAACLDPTSAAPVVAIKRLLTHHAKDPEFLKMFVDEARVSMQVRHRNVVTTYECIEIPGSLALVMDYVAGDSLTELQRAAKRLNESIPLPIIGNIVSDALLGLHAAHETCDEHGTPLGVIHRDVSPQNVMVSLYGVSRVIDFGIARAAGRLQETESGVVKGKFAYMSPEQLAGRPLSPRSDVYGMGAVLWELLAGRKLFAGSSQELMVKRALGAAVEPPSTVVPSVSPRIDEVVMSALSSDPEQRYPTAKHMADAVRDALGYAPQSVVADWVARLASPGLMERERKREMLEASFGSTLVQRAPSFAKGSGPDSQPPSIRGDRLGGDRLATDRLASDRLASDRLATDRLATDTGDSGKRLRDMSAAPHSSRTLASAHVPAALMRSDIDPRARETVLSAPRPPSKVQATAKKKRARGGRWRQVAPWLAMLGVGYGGLLAAKYGLKAGLVSAAEKRGVDLSIDEVTIGSSGPVFHGLTASLTGYPDLTVKADDASLANDTRGVRVVVPKFDLHVHGSPAAVAERVVAWRKQSRGQVRIEAAGGHAVWDGLLGWDSLESHETIVQLAMDTDDDVGVELRRATIHLPKAQLGPWTWRLTGDAATTQLVVALHPASKDPPEISLTMRPDLGMAVDFKIPSTPLSAIGVPPALVGMPDDERVALAMDGLVPPSGHPVKARWRLSLDQAPPAGTTSGTPLFTFDGEISGDPPEAIEIRHGIVSVGQQAATALHGTVKLAGEGLILELRDEPAPSPYAKAREWSLDTHKWTQP